MPRLPPLGHLRRVGEGFEDGLVGVYIEGVSHISASHSRAKIAACWPSGSEMAQPINQLLADDPGRDLRSSVSTNSVMECGVSRYTPTCAGCSPAVASPRSLVRNVASALGTASPRVNRLCQAARFAAGAGLPSWVRG